MAEKPDFWQEVFPFSELPLGAPFPKEREGQGVALGEGRGNKSEWILLHPNGRERIYLAGRWLKVFSKCVNEGESGLSRQQRNGLASLGLLPVPEWCLEALGGKDQGKRGVRASL